MFGGRNGVNLSSSIDGGKGGGGCRQMAEFEGEQSEAGEIPLELDGLTKTGAVEV